MYVCVGVYVCGFVFLKKKKEYESHFHSSHAAISFVRFACIKNFFIYLISQMEDATFLAFPGLDLTVGKTENQVAKT